MDLQTDQNNTYWLDEVLIETGLQQFYPKLTKDLQLTKLSHFDYVSEDDLIQLGMSKPAAKRLLAAIKKPNSSQSSKDKHNNDFFSNSSSSGDFGRLTCLINSQDVQIKEEIGHGVHGFVKKGEWTAPNGRVIEVALKILRKDVMSEPGASFNDFVKEISVMHQLNHPNIIKLYGVVLSSPMMMVTELAPFGNLRDRLRKENGNTPISQLISFGVQIASGMEYLESKRFVHRDLAARNIFISHGKKILIGDLGLMRAIPTQEDHYLMSEKTKIPYPWCAPESLRYKKFSSASDVYMFGVTLWEMFSFGKEPWAGLNLNDILENISSQKRRLPCPQACPTMVYQTLLQCWNTEPSCRPNFSTLYQYLSTSYPLEVRSTQHISELGQKRQNGNLVPDDLNESFSTLSHNDSKQEKSISCNFYRKVLTCQVNDRIQVIDGQPEKYWWKGQNQRSFEIGWFPLCSTRWLAPKRNTNYISKPLKNSFVHAGHCGMDGKWGGPKWLDNAQSKNPLSHNDLNAFSPLGGTPKGLVHRQTPKSKAKSRLSKLFGINESPSTTLNELLPHSYQKFNNESSYTSGVGKRNNEARFNSLVRSQSDDAAIAEKTIDNSPPLIDLSDDSTSTVAHPIQLNTSLPATQQSLIDMDNKFSAAGQAGPIQRGSSDTRLNEIDPVGEYTGSWAGSWNTGTFDGSTGNIYSGYYCPQDAAATAANQTDHQDMATNRYYSAVCQEESSNNS